ncbi:RNA polymerase sigma factor, partial [Sphingopyxis sp.]|uniref:RNA polymerase sigma factor n=1 Tax=Sphingopyxis sp. TaxID=1908224 RepID=UPI002ED90D28
TNAILGWRESRQLFPEFQSVYVRYRQPVMRWFRKRGLDHAAAEDCTQECFARLYSRGSTNLERLDAYIYVVAASVLTDRWRKGKVRQETNHVPLENIQVPTEELTPARVFEGKDALLRLSATLDELPERTREMFLLNRLDKFSYQQIAARFGISVSGVEKHMMRAIAHVHARMSSDDR